MSLTVDGVWKAGVWNPTVWAAGVWYEPISASAPLGSGGNYWLRTQLAQNAAKLKRNRQNNDAILVLLMT